MQMSNFYTAFAAAILSFSGGALATGPRAPRAPASVADEIPAVIEGKRGGPVTDLGSLKGIGIETLGTCLENYSPDVVTPSGTRIKMLGAAFVYMGPANGTSVLGHSGERFVYCRNDELFDAVYEYEKPEEGMIGPSFEKQYGIRLADYSDAEKKNLANALYLEVSLDPAEYYAFEQTQIMRTIYETWFELDGAKMYEMLAANAKRYAEQTRKIKAHEPLDGYSLFKNNCATPVSQDMAIINPEFLHHHGPLPIMPAEIYRGVNKDPAKVRQIIVYPSQRLFRQLRLKQQGKSRLFEGFVPLSKSLRGTFRGSWVLLYDDGSTEWRKMLLRPIYGAVNLGAGVAETLLGVITTPLTFFEKITGIEKHRRKKLAARAAARKAELEAEGLDASAISLTPRTISDKLGPARVVKGLRDMFSSLGEVFTLELRHPRVTAWSEEEKTFFRDLEQNSALLEYMKAEWEKAPLIIQGEGKDDLTEEDVREIDAEPADER